MQNEAIHKTNIQSGVLIIQFAFFDFVSQLDDTPLKIVLMFKVQK